MYFVHPSDIEKFAMRLLLIHKIGEKGFTDLRTINGIVHDSYQDAAVSLGLMESSYELDYLLKEACDTITDINQLRELFSVILMNCQPSKPSELWTKFKKHLYEDYYYSLSKQLTNIQEAELILNCENLCLYEIDCILQRSGKNLNKYAGLPTDDIKLVQKLLNSTDSNIIAEELNYDKDLLTKELNENLPKMNEDQTNAFDTIKKAIYTTTKTSKLPLLSKNFYSYYFLLLS